MEIVCTIGPATFNPAMVRMLWCAGVTIFRLNLSHTDTLSEIDRFISMIREDTDGKTCLDTHGMKFCSGVDSEPFTRFDLRAIKHAMNKVDYIAVSFAQSAKSVEFAKDFSNDAFTIAKIESMRGISNQTEIIDKSDAILIDRGDLSRTVPIKEVPKYCKEIILTTKSMGKPVWVATNLLESMVNSPQPTMGEVNDIASLLLLGIDGLVLAAETAIGKYPIQCVEFVRDMIELYTGNEYA